MTSTQVNLIFYIQGKIVRMNSLFTNTLIEFNIDIKGEGETGGWRESKSERILKVKNQLYILVWVLASQDGVPSFGHF